MTETYKSTIMRRFQIFLLAIMLLSAQQAGAQKGLRVNDVFEGDVVAKDNMVVNIIKGELQTALLPQSEVQVLRGRTAED